MTSGFQHQQRQVNFAFPRTVARQQAVGQRLEPPKEEPKVPPAEPRSFEP